MLPERGRWRIVESDVVIDTPHLRLRRDRVALPNGLEIEPYYVRESLGFAVVFAIAPDGRVVLVRQYKHGIGAFELELPAGGLEPGEAAATCALRELAEETGYVADAATLEYVGAYVFDPTNATTRYHLYIARDARALRAQALDATEEITVELATFEELLRYVRDGTIDVASHIASIYLVLDRLGHFGGASASSRT